VRHEFFIVQSPGEKHMKNEFRKTVGEDKPQLAIVKRIDEFPTWKKPAESNTSEQELEYIFEIKVKKDKKSKKKQGKNIFKNWNLPIQPQGYLKPRVNDLL
jgi:hypothetical protein